MEFLVQKEVKVIKEMLVSMVNVVKEAKRVTKVKLGQQGPQGWMPHAHLGQMACHWPAVAMGVTIIWVGLPGNPNQELD